MGSKKSTTFSIEDFSKLSIREQIEHRQDRVKQVVKLKNDIADQEKYLVDFNNMIENNTPTFEKGGIYCTVGLDGNIDIETDLGLPSKKTIKEFCAFLMKHFG